MISSKDMHEDVQLAAQAAATELARHHFNQGRVEHARAMAAHLPQSDAAAGELSALVEAHLKNADAAELERLRTVLALDAVRSRKRLTARIQQALLGQPPAA